MIGEFSRIRLRAATELRAVARRLGLTPYLSKLRHAVQTIAGDAAYEAHFDRALMRAVRPGDVVWDIGANVGLYTTRFSDAVGERGRVVAFEPTPSCFAELQRATHARGNVTAMNLALGDTAGTARMTVADDPLGATHSLVASAGGETIEVRVARGDLLATDEGVPAPNVIKLDVEGFEEEVLVGLAGFLNEPSCRAVLCEIHFGILDARGRRQAPARIESRLRDAGFCVRWVDASHLAAERA